MAECPHCHQEITINEINYGTLFNCPLCNAVYFVGWDGLPEMPPTAEEMAAENIEPLPEVNSEQDVVVENAYISFEKNANEVVIDNSTYEDSNYESLQSSEVDHQTARSTEMISTADQPGFADVIDFANADMAVGPLSYNLQISGIDSGKIYGQLKEALTDSRFGWDVQELLKTIQNGTLNLKGLNPAKAFVLVNRIKYLPLRISWRQDVLATL